MSRKQVALGMSVMCVISSVVGCSVKLQSADGGEAGFGGSGGSSNATDEARRAAIDEVVRASGMLAVADAEPKTEVTCSDCPTNGQEGDAYCAYARVRETRRYDEYVAFQPNSATLWPGNVVRGADAARGDLVPVSVPLAPVTFSVSLENLTGSPVGRMDSPSLSNFREERNRILSGEVTGATPANLHLDVTQVYSESHLAVEVGASVDAVGFGSFSGSFGFNSSDKRTKIVVNFTQAYYTIDVDTPQRPADLFGPSVTAGQIAEFVSSDSPPLYVQSITYGRRVLFTIESDDTFDEIDTSVSASFDAILADVGGSVSTSQSERLSSSRIQAFVLGGGGAEAVGVIDGFDGLKEYIKSGGDYSKDSPGAPIAYKLAYLDNTPARFALTTEYTERNCNKNRADVTVQLLNIHDFTGDGVGASEFFGLVDFLYPNAVHNGACNGTSALASSAAVMNYSPGQYWSPMSPLQVTVLDVPVGPDANLCLRADLTESDQFFDDYYGYDEAQVPWSSGWEGSQTVQLRADGNSADVELNVIVK